MQKTKSDEPRSRGKRQTPDDAFGNTRVGRHNRGADRTFATRDTNVFSGARTTCRFCRRAISYVDYKDVDTLAKLLTNRGKIYSRRRSGNCASCQRKVKKAIKRARYMALLPFST